jgi:uncharacterized membrane protein HdeD (DUF308 family)
MAEDSLAVRALKGGTTASLILGVLLIILGFVAILAPWEAGIAIVLIVGWTIIFSGGALVFYAIRTHSGGRAILEAILGLIYIAAGIYILMHPLGGLLALTLLLASFFLIYGIIALVLAFRMRPHRGWGWVLLDAIVTILLGLLIYIHWPANTEWVVGTLVGLSILISGFTRVMVSLAFRKLATTTA